MYCINDYPEASFFFFHCPSVCHQIINEQLLGYFNRAPSGRGSSKAVFQLQQLSQQYQYQQLYNARCIFPPQCMHSAIILNFFFVSLQPIFLILCCPINHVSLHGTIYNDYSSMSKTEIIHFFVFQDTLLMTLHIINIMCFQFCLSKLC